MSKKGENIYKRKDGRWEGRYIRCYDENGKARYGYIYGRTYSSVKQRLIEKKAYVEAEKELSRCTALFGEVLNGWLSQIRSGVKQSTYARYYSLVNNHIRPYLGRFQISKMSNQLFERFIEEKLRNGRIDGKGGLSAKTVSDILMIIKKVSDYAETSGLVVGYRLQHLSVKRHERGIRVLCQEEQLALLKVLVREMDFCKFGVLLSLFTGIRIGELCALKWGDFDDSVSVMSVHCTMQRVQNCEIFGMSRTSVIITEPKTENSFRDIPLPPFLSDIAMNLRQDPEAYILTGRRDRYIEPRTMQYRFKSIIAESGIKNINFHALRHTFATRCIEKDFELKTLSEILGHSTVNMTLNRYVHSSMELKSVNMNKLDLAL